MKQTELAKIVDISPRHLNRILRRKAMPGADIAIKIAREIGCSVEDLWGNGSRKPIRLPDDDLDESNGKATA